MSVVVPTISLVITILLGVGGLWLAYQQVSAAKQKLLQNLFDRRFVVFTATQNFMLICLSNQKCTHEQRGAFYAAARPAPFLFDRSLDEFLDDVMRRSADVVDSRSSQNEERVESALRWFEQEVGSITNRFYDFLNLTGIRQASPSERVSPEHIKDYASLSDRQ